MFDELHPAETAAALKDRALRPESVTPSAPGVFTGFWRSLRDALPAAGLESSRALLSVTQAYGEAAGEKEQALSEFVTGHPLETGTGGPDMDAAVRASLERFTPDPRETGVAAQVVFGAGKMLGKAAAYGTLGGVPGAVAGVGLDEGINETLKLTDRGVDLGTAAEVGAVHGVLSGATIALPVAGQTLKATAGLALAGGPGSFMLEQAVSREILKAEDYAAISAGYDPFDVTGLLASILTAGVVGTAAHVVRPKVSADEVAAARTLVDAQHVETQSLAPREDIAAQTANSEAMAQARTQLDRGEPVDVDVPADSARVEAVKQRLESGLREADLTAEVAGAEFGEMRNESLADFADRAGEEIGGVSHLRGIVSSLVRAYVMHGPEAGRARLEQLAAEAPESSGFSEEVATKGFLAELDAEITKRAAAFKARPADVVSKKADLAKTQTEVIAQARESADLGTSGKSAESPEIGQAQSILARSEDLRIPDDLGGEISAKEALEQADAQLKETQGPLAKATQAAAECLLESAL